MAVSFDISMALFDAFGVERVGTGSGDY